MKKFKQLSRAEMKNVTGGTGGGGGCRFSYPCGVNIGGVYVAGVCDGSIGTDCGCNIEGQLYVDNTECKIP